MPLISIILFTTIDVVRERYVCVCVYNTEKMKEFGERVVYSIAVLVWIKEDKTVTLTIHWAQNILIKSTLVISQNALLVFLFFNR